MKNKYIDFSPRAKEVEQLREKKDVEFRNKARIEKEINRRVKLEKLKSQTSVADQEANDSQLDELPPNPYVSAPQKG